MTITNQPAGGGSWGRHVRVAAGAAIVGAAVSSWAIATAQADATSDATIGAVGSLGDTAVGDIGNLLNVDAAVSPISTAIDAAAAPINTAQTLLEAVPAASLTGDDLAVVMGQEGINVEQLGFLDTLETFQLGLTNADPADLVAIDNYLGAFDANVLDATQGFLATLAEPGFDMSAFMDLLGADLQMAFGDATALPLSLLAEFTGSLGMDALFVP